MRRGCCVRRLASLSRVQFSAAIDLAMHFLAIRPQRCHHLLYNYGVVCLCVDGRKHGCYQERLHAAAVNMPVATLWPTAGPSRL